MKEYIAVLAYLAVAVVVGVALAIMMRRCNSTRLLAKDEYYPVAALSLIWPAVLVGATGGIAVLAVIKVFAVVIRLALRAVDAAALKMKRGAK